MGASEKGINGDGTLNTFQKVSCGRVQGQACAETIILQYSHDLQIHRLLLCIHSLHQIIKLITVPV